MGKTALITGAPSGIGYELAKCFAGDGANLVLVARDPARLNQIASELQSAFGVSAKVIPADLSRATENHSIIALSGSCTGSASPEASGTVF